MDKKKDEHKSIDESVAEACGLRRCPQCGYVVVDPMVARCPRCWGSVPTMGCEGCTGCSLHLSR